ncbi:MAG: DNA mismatch repair protein MutS [Eudoraea sp.]|nr:DNA mismatch repair protein MutS [Eudoraea sp.]NNK29342.1 DNA mismatch repair protein MutS [Flavobacteriaceae bacterium]
MQDPNEYYSRRLTELKAEKKKLSGQLFRYSLLRLLVFLSVLFALYFFYGEVQLLIGLGLLALVVFVFLVMRFNHLQFQKQKCDALIQLNETELAALKGDYLQLAEGAEYEDGEHHFSRDIDLFGVGSFFQYINRTALTEGKNILAKWLMSNHNEQLVLKQEAIKELRDAPEWRQEYTAIAAMVSTEATPSQLSKWFREYQPILNGRFKIIPLAFGLISLALIAAYLINALSGWSLFFWFLAGLGISGFYLKRINRLAVLSANALDTFQQFHKLIHLLETTSFNAELLTQKQVIFNNDEEAVSRSVRKFADILHAFDQRNNMLIGILGNGFLLLDLYQTYRIEHWIQKHGEEVNSWFEVLGYFDACNSLGNFAFNHPAYVFPELSADSIVIKAEGAGHPLLDKESRVTNDFLIREHDFHIITGANMAGKSTFLRTVSLLIVMANTGLPVCATSMRYKPIKLVTSMRTADSLTRHESYFFSELKRLKFIVEEMAKDRYFIVLDEILKGTNSTDKAQGSRQFLDRLVASKSTGLIATHDLSLCSAAKAYGQVSNYYFDAEIVKGELHFDYQLKPGICQNMNASFLLKKLKIVE